MTKKNAVFFQEQEDLLVNKARPRAVIGFITHIRNRFVWILRVEVAVRSFVWLDSRGISCIHHKFRCPGSIITLKSSFGHRHRSFSERFVAFVFEALGLLSSR